MRLLLRWLLSADERRRLDEDLAPLFDARERESGCTEANRWLREQLRQAAWYAFTCRLATVRDVLRELRPSGVREWRLMAATLRRSPLSTLTIVATVGIAGGVFLAMFATWRAVAITPLPYRDAEALVWIYTDNPPNRFRFSVVDYRALEADHPAFERIAAYQTQEVTIGASGTPTRGLVRSVTGSYFPLLGLQPALGRLFDESDRRPDAPLVVLSHDYWRAAYGGDRAIVGASLPINGLAHTIVGVLASSRGPLERNIAAYTVEQWPEPRRKGPFFTTAIGRPRPEASLSVVRESLRATNARLFPIWQSSYQDRTSTWNVQPLKERTIGDAGAVLGWLLAAMSLVLLIALSNAMHLLVARGMDRRHEWAVRRALGASLIQLYRPLALESIALSLACGASALAVCRSLIGVGQQYGRAFLPRIEEVGMTPDLWASAAALTLGAATLFLIGGLMPAARSSASSMDTQLRHHRTTSEDRATRRTRGWLVAGQLALTTPLLVLAALTIISLRHLTSVPLGFDHTSLVSARISLAGDRYATEEPRAALWTRLLDQLRALPGVEAVALADGRPPDIANNINNFELEDRPTPPEQNQPVSVWVSTTPDYFSTLGIQLERGQLLDGRALDGNSIVVDRAWADRFLPGLDAVGKRLKSGGCTECPWTTIVGVVNTVRWQGLDAPEEGAVYYPFVNWPNGYVMLRTALPPSEMTETVRRTIAEVDPSLAITQVTTGDGLTDATLITPRYLAMAASAFGLLAVVLAAAGLVAILSHFARQHRNEFGVRLALGGQPSDIRRLMLRQSLRTCAVGLLGGAMLASLAARIMVTRLSGTADAAWLVVGAVVLGLLTLAVLLAIPPGRLAARVNPADLLRTT